MRIELNGTGPSSADASNSNLHIAVSANHLHYGFQQKLETKSTDLTQNSPRLLGR